MSRRNISRVQKFYQDSCVFVTGGTGFLGKLIIEKILRSCPDVGKVYVLIRPKKGLTVDERISSLLNTVVFDRLKSERPGSLEKIVFVPGDCSSPRLGLSDSDYHDLTQHVNIVLHLAANVRFDEKLKVAMNVNVKGVVEVINLCRHCHSLKAGVFVSTAFSNCNRQIVKEKLYDPPSVGYEEMLTLMDRLTERELEILSHKITGSWKIPYLFSKATIENIISKDAKGLPVAIVRPSMVVSTMKEPLEGWVDNMYGPISIIVGVASGVLRVNSVKDSLTLDGVPADTISNCIISVASVTNNSTSDIIPVYNVATSDCNPVTIKAVVDTYMQFRDSYPLKRVIWSPFMISVANFKLYTILSLLLHVLPGYLVDMALRLKGQPPMLMKIYRKLRVYAIITNLFPIKDFRFVCEKTLKLYESLDSEDKELFPFDIRKIIWEDFMLMTCLESRKYILHENLDNLEESRSWNRKLLIIHTVTKYLLYGVAIRAAWCIITAFMPVIY